MNELRSCEEIASDIIISAKKNVKVCVELNQLQTNQQCVDMLVVDIHQGVMKSLQSERSRAEKFKEALEFVKADPNTVNPNAHMVIDEALEQDGK